MILGTRVTVEGLCSTPSPTDDRTLVTNLLAIELPSYFSFLSIDERTEALFKSLYSKGNAQRIFDISNEITELICGNGKAAFPALTFTISGKPDLAYKKNGLSKLSYDPHSTAIAGGVLELVAIARLLGFEHRFEPTRKVTKHDLVTNASIRQKLAQTSIQVTTVFNTEKGLSNDDLFEYFAKYNNRDTRLHSSGTQSMLDRSKINDFVIQIAEDIKLEQYGGMIHSALRLNKSEPGIVAEATLIKLVLGAIGGSSPQDKNRVDDFNLNKGKFSVVAINNARTNITEFLRLWLDGVREQFKANRDGFHYSPSLWLALGLVINRIISDYPSDTTQHIQRVALHLSQLDYSKSAKHWANCEVLELDAKRTEYKNASGGGRPLRIGLAEYLYRCAQSI